MTENTPTFKETASRLHGDAKAIEELSFILIHMVPRSRSWYINSIDDKIQKVIENLNTLRTKVDE